MRRFLLGLCVLLASACSGDVSGPACDGVKACAVRGSDLAVARVALDSSLVSYAAQASAASFPVRVDVVNRGTATSAPRRVQVAAWTDSGTVEIPGLAPGQVHSAVVRLSIGRRYLVITVDPPTITPVGRILEAADADPSNDVLRGDEFRVDLPLLEVVPIPLARQSVRGPGDSVSIGALVRQEVDLAYRQVPPIRALLCIRAAGGSCGSSTWSPLTSYSFLPTQGFSRHAHRMELPAGATPAVPGVYRLAFCIVPDLSSPPGDAWDDDHACVDTGELEILP